MTKNSPVTSYNDFWNWFKDNEKNFYKVLKNKENVERDFFKKLAAKLNRFRDVYSFMAGMIENNTAELIITADSILKYIVFVEELVQSAPKIDNWKFTALKPPVNIDKLYINMQNWKFNKDNLYFYYNDNPKYPDEIDITIVYTEYQDDFRDIITHGVFLFIDNYLGELNFATTIDKMQIIGKDEAEKELIPIEKLKSFLLWRQKEFIEKYEITGYNTENDQYKLIEATLYNGTPIMAIINSTLLDWDSKASHPYILNIEIYYDGIENGLPDKRTYKLMEKFEDELLLELKAPEGYLSIGRRTGDNLREIYFACKDFRYPSKIITEFQEKYKNKLDIDYDIFKDKYWKSFEQFRQTV